MSRTISPSFWILSLVSIASLTISLFLLVKQEVNEDDTLTKRPAKVAAAPVSILLPSLEMPPAMDAPQLTLPESPLLKPTMPGKNTTDILAKLRRANFSRMRLDETMMNGELDRYRAPPAGSTDPDSMWRGQVDRANRTLQENGMGHLNLRGR